MVARSLKFRSRFRCSTEPKPVREEETPNTKKNWSTTSITSKSKKPKPCQAHWSNNLIVYGPHTKSEILKGRQASKRRPLEPVPENEPKENRQNEKTDKTTPGFENDVTFDPLKKSATMTTSARDDISVDSRSAVNQVKAAIDGIWSTTLELEKLYLYE